MSIQFAPSSYIILNKDGATVETNDYTAVTRVAADFAKGTVEVTIPVGTMQDGKFVQSKTETPLVVVVDLDTGDYFPQDSVLFKPGTLAPELMSQFRALFNTVRNSLEQATLYSGAIQGAHTAW